jgi:CrcB protein
MLKLMLVGIGGFAGSTSRYMLGAWVHRVLKNPGFPYGTLAVNVLGCLLIGLLGGIAEQQRWFTPETHLLIILGFLGGFTTFSSFGYETYSMAAQSRFPVAALNIVVQLLFGLGAVWVGRIAATSIAGTS